MALLEVRKMTKFFSGLTAVMELTMDVHRKQIFGLIGPNGAGKSTALNMIGGTLLPSQGQVIFDGEKITKLPSHRRTQRGIARIFQENLLFRSFTVLENVLVGCQLQREIGLSSIFLNTGSNRTQEEARQRRAFNTLKFVGLAQYANELAINLPHGRQRLLALAIALATQPELLLLYEPVTGMNVEEVETMLAMITALREQSSSVKMLSETLKN